MLRNVTLLPFGTNKKGICINKNDLHALKSNYYGALDHPNTFDVSMLNVSHTISNIYSDNLSLYGDIKILDTSKGQILNHLVDDDLVVFRPRMSIDSNGHITIFAFDAITKDKDIYIDVLKERYKKIKKLHGRLSKKHRIE
ncbi:MAG: hypothetical protein ACOC3V_02710 [bacterium]